MAPRPHPPASRSRLRRGVAPTFPVVLALGASLVAGATRAGEDAPLRVVQQANDGLLAALAQHPKDDASAERAVQAVLDRNVDYQRLADLVLAPTCTSWPPADCVRVTDVFVRLLRRATARNLIRFRGAVFSYAGQRIEGEQAVVLVRAYQGRDRAAVEYRLERRPVGWRVIDINIDGIRAVSNYQAQFAVLLSRGSVPEVIAQLEREVAAFGPGAGSPGGTTRGRGGSR